MGEFTHPLAKYFRDGIKYTTCPGCGNGIAAQSVLWGIEAMGGNIDEYAFVSGIGCSGWIPSPAFSADLLHVTHGRSLPVATGLKIALPHQKVVVFQGDGDLSAIGGNHFIHACRRNVDLTVVCINNGIYGMTGGQAAPTTPLNFKTSTTPLGNVERGFDLSALAMASGATFVARWTTWHAAQITNSFKKAVNHQGFAFLEIVSQCPVQYGKAAGMRNDPVAMLNNYKENSVPISAAAKLSEEEKRGKIIIGELFYDPSVPEFTAELARLKKEGQRGL
ncbi:2-oxoglutarate synthase [Synergistales bacterium]|nr:2-oxoglutarate synthase [Synergistales bacterium]